jgi:hypothetical protein
MGFNSRDLSVKLSESCGGCTNTPPPPGHPKPECGCTSTPPKPGVPPPCGCTSTPPRDGRAENDFGGMALSALRQQLRETLAQAR